MVDAPPAHRQSKERRANGPRLRPRRLLRLTLSTLAVSWSATPLLGWAQRSCGEWHATFVAVEGAPGAVEFRRDDTERWQPAALGVAVCTGYSVRVGEFGDATLQFPDKTALRLHRNSTMTLDEPEDDTGIWVDLVQGLLHIISRDPRALRFTTPYANAGLEGTEFEIGVANRRTDVTVIEGEVSMSNAAGRVGVHAGERGRAVSGNAPQTAPLPQPFEGTDWTSYYAPILYLSLPAPGSTSASAETDPEYLAARAASRLALSDVDGAERDIESALRAAPGNATALAVESLLALGRGDKAKALETARSAVTADAASVPARIALAHAQRAGFDFVGAQHTLTEATRLAPGNALAWALLAEVRLSRDDGKNALAAARQATRLAPDLARVHTVLGFAQLGLAVEEAMTAFSRATELDPADPLPRIGMASALLARGDFVAARDQSEIAVILDPRNPQTRSFMAKIYAQEDRTELSESQLEIARQLDPSDPTPAYYDSLTKQAQNRPIEALRAHRAASTLNSNRPVFRSTLRLDEDLPVRSAGLGQLQRDLDFPNLALLEGWKATLEDPADYSGHRLLTDVYSTLPRHEIARVNELYRSQLLQPINVTPVPPQLAEANLFILENAGPSDLGFSEFTPYVRENGLSFLGSAVAGGAGTTGADFVASGLTDRISYSAGHFAFKSDGFRENNDIDQRVTNALVQFRPTRATSLLAELRSSDIDKGDLRMFFDPDAYIPDSRQTESIDSIRTGLRHRISDRGTLLASLVGENQDFSFTSIGTFGIDTHRRSASLDVQHIVRTERWQLTSGVRHAETWVNEQNTIPSPFPPYAPAVFTTDYKIDHSVAYAYTDLKPTPKITTTLGLSTDVLSTPDNQERQWNPKLGLIYEPNARTTLRVSALQTLEGPLSSRYNIQPRLEPTHVAGFNQFYYGSEGEKTQRWGFGADHGFSSRFFGGIEASKRRVERETRVFQQNQPASVETETRDEALLRGYMYWTPTDTLSFAAEYRYESVDTEGQFLSDGVMTSRTHRLPLSLNYFAPNGLRAGVTTTYVSQTGDFTPRVENTMIPIIEHGEDDFWVVDLSLGYRLPRRRGSISLEMDNVFDREFRFQDTDPENPTIMPERLLALRFTLAY